MEPTRKHPKLLARIKRLEMELEHARACQVHTAHFAHRALDKLTIPKLTGSSVILTISKYHGEVVVGPVSIKNGLSDETIAAIKADLVRTYNEAIEFKP